MTTTDHTGGPPAGPVPDDSHLLDELGFATPGGDTAPAAEPVSEPVSEPAAAEAKPTTRDKVIAWAAAAGAAFATWWGFARQPMAVAEAWRRSGEIDARRIPADSPLLAWAWWVSNRVDRPLLFMLLGVLPAWLNGPLLWCAVRPTRRWGLYLVVLLLTAVVPSLTAG